MIETVDNIIQIILTGFCTFYSIYRAVKTSRREWILLGLFSGAFLLGDIYYILWLNLYSGTSFDSDIPYLCWYTSYFFLILLILNIKEKRPPQWPPIKMFLIPVFTAIMCLIFIVKGDILSNVVTFGLMTILMWNAADELRMLKEENTHLNHLKQLYSLTLAFCLLEYALWITSFFWMGNTIFNPYFWIDTMISVCFVLYVVIFRRGVDA